MAIHKIDPTKTVRPDRYDFRDREYRPRVTNLPPVWPLPSVLKKQIRDYRDKKLVLDQGDEGACTGFGLAAVMYCLAWRQWEADKGTGDRPGLPSPRMLYDLARIYDEWEGEEGSGSSCRGAMKGWHKHGACDLSHWPRDKGHDNTKPDWAQGAIKRPLGAYYRVEARSLVDMQYAVHEIGAIYCSAKVHSGWTLSGDEETVKVAGFTLPVISDPGDRTGGHAFAILGYTSDGFVIQNSSGPGWGKHGFAILSYKDWVRNGYDAWVAALAAPIPALDGVSSPTSSSGEALVSTAISRASGLDHQGPQNGNGGYRWSLDKAYDHALVMGNNGRLLRRRVDVIGDDGALDHLVETVVSRAVKLGRKRIAVIVHSGLLDEKSTMARIRALGPWIEANGICPIFVVWRTSLADALESIGREVVPKFEDQQQRIAGAVGKSLLRTARRRLQKQFDKAFEVRAEKALGKATWSQIKENAAAAAEPDGAASRLLEKLVALVNSTDDAELHFVSHSSGAILLGNLVRDLQADARVKTVTLLAPACTTDFASETFGSLFTRGVLKPERSFRVHILSDEIERADSVGSYGNSILYLVSRALEKKRKTPILGMAETWLTDDETGDLLGPKQIAEKLPALEWLFDENQIDAILYWHDIARANRIRPDIKRQRTVTIFESGEVKETLQRGHDTFDNDIETIQATIDLITEDNSMAPVDDLREFNTDA